MLGRLKFDLDVLANEMLSQIPNWVFESDSTTFLDPAMGGGQFLRAVAAKLRKYGHSEENIASRLFGMESFGRSVRFAKKKGTVGTLWVGGLNDLEWMEKMSMKFDVVLGNPPYQSNNGSGSISGSGPGALWIKISTAGIDLAQEFALFVTPKTTFTSPAKSLKIFKNGGMKYHIPIVFDTTEHLKVGQQTNAWIMSKTSPISNTNYYGMDIDLQQFPFIPESKINMSILGKLLKCTPKLIFSTGDQWAEEDYKTDSTDEYQYPIDANGKIRHIKEKTKNSDRPKVLMPQLSKIKPYYSDTIGNSPSTMKMFVDNEVEGKVLESVMNSKLYQFCIELVRVDGRITWGINYIPIPDLTRTWTDQELYVHFNLTQKEIDYVEANTK